MLATDQHTERMGWYRSIVETRQPSYNKNMVFVSSDDHVAQFCQSIGVFDW